MTLYLWGGIIVKLSISEHALNGTLLLKRTKKINNCIANSKKFFIVETIKTSTKGKEIHISCKANLVNKAKDVKSNFKALECETN